MCSTGFILFHAVFGFLLYPAGHSICSGADQAVRYWFLHLLKYRIEVPDGLRRADLRGFSEFGLAVNETTRYGCAYCYSEIDTLIAIQYGTDNTGPRRQFAALCGRLFLQEPSHGNLLVLHGFSLVDQMPK